MRGVVDDPSLLALAGTDPMVVRRLSWVIGSSLAAVSGVLLAPVVGLDPTALTLLVIQAFGAAAIGRFTNLPLTFVGGLAIGVGASVSSKYISAVPALSGLPPSLPFLVLFAALVFAGRQRLTEIGRAATSAIALPPVRPTGVRWALAAGGALAVALVPALVGARLPVFVTAAVYVLLLASLRVLLVTSDQVSLCHVRVCGGRCHDLRASHLRPRLAVADRAPPRWAPDGPDRRAWWRFPPSGSPVCTWRWPRSASGSSSSVCCSHSA